MNLKYLLFFVSTLLVTVSAPELVVAKQVAITFDDSPRAASGYLTGPERAKRLIAELKKHKVPEVVFFSNSGKIDKEGDERLKTYGNAGHVIANHTHSHPDFNKLTLSEFADEFKLADQKLKDYKNFKPYFRFPYLREGNTAEKVNGMRNLFKETGYQNAYVTLNNYDWYIERLFQEAIKTDPKLDMKKMSQFYVDVLMESIEYYDELAIKHIGRSPKHILLLHEMDITALFIGDLVSTLRAKGWEIIDLETALTDDISKYETKQLYPYNPGRIGEIARDNGQKKGLWPSLLNEKYLAKRFNEDVNSLPDSK